MHVILNLVELQRNDKLHNLYQIEELFGTGAMAHTILDEELGFRPEVVEAQLAHSVRDPQGRAYNRTGYLTERRKMMQAWAD